jgi:hypothetical protein
MANPFCKCGHRRSDHRETLNDWLECEEDECECPIYGRARGELAKTLNEGKVKEE